MNMKFLLFLTFVFSAAANAMSGQALVTDLNTKYQSNVAQCSNGAPAYYCSGVLLRAVDYSTSFKFWDYGSQATKLGSVAFTYIRSDVGSTTLNSNRKSGFILKDQTSALVAGKVLNLRCIFPFPTESLDIRADHGCGFAPKNMQVDPDLANCAKLWGSPVTAAAWLKNFKEHQSLPQNQCSLSTVVAAQFKASLEAHKLVDATWTAKPMEVLVQTWDESKPEKIPVEAVFYDATVPAKLADAQKFQREYYAATSLYVPVIRMNLTAANKEIFSFSATDQVYGQVVAERLNARYSSTSNDCGGKAAYYCSGILVRTTGASEKYHAWDPSPSSETSGSVSFSYLRTDLGVARLFSGETQGFVFKDQNAVEKNAYYPVAILCTYPSDGAIYPNRSNKGCGAHSWYPDSSRSCPEEGVTTLAKWVSHFHRTSQRYLSQCSFTPDKDQFTISLQARNAFQHPSDRINYNEVVVAVWPKGRRDLPIEAFVYVTAPGRAVGLEGAKYMQKDYYNTVGDIVPVIRLVLGNGPATAFNYFSQDQAVDTSGRVLAAD
ncbi:hypothetical protein BK670_20700 [Pseudomonas fluorescens]|uniref:Halovibrin HvnA n=2 Tax=Pseudomonas fluorescens TaxID=294 RepID=A0A423MAR2_PSEFL|nr:hypothetical protein BK670_20700 [Pseudomonas fluorescens]